MDAWMRKKTEKGWDCKFNVLYTTRFYKNLKRNSPKLQFQSKQISNARNLKFSQKKAKIHKLQILKLSRVKRMKKKNDQRCLNY